MPPSRSEKSPLIFKTFKERLNRLSSDPENFMKEFMYLHQEIGVPSYNNLLSAYNANSKNKLTFTFHIVKLHDPSTDETYYFRIDKNGIRYYDEADDDDLIYIYSTLNTSLLKSLSTTGDAICSSKLNKQYILLSLTA